MKTPTEQQIHALENQGKISHATWCNALRALHGESSSFLGPLALRKCADILSGKRPDDQMDP